MVMKRGKVGVWMGQKGLHEEGSRECGKTTQRKARGQSKVRLLAAGGSQECKQHRKTFDDGRSGKRRG
jgi:hypothetical protein